MSLQISISHGRLKKNREEQLKSVADWSDKLGLIHEWIVGFTIVTLCSHWDSTSDKIRYFCTYFYEILGTKGIIILRRIIVYIYKETIKFIIYVYFLHGWIQSPFW